MRGQFSFARARKWLGVEALQGHAPLKLDRPRQIARDNFDNAQGRRLWDVQFVLRGGWQRAAITILCVRRMYFLVCTVYVVGIVDWVHRVKK